MHRPDADREPRVAYFVSSYRSPDQLRRLLGTLRAAQPDAPLLVFHNVFASTIDPELLADVGARLFTSESPIVWGDISLDRARWDVLRWAVEHVDFDWLVLLSEQDYPIAPLGELGRRLANSGVDAVLDTEPITEIASAAQRRDCHWRYHYRRVALPTWGLSARLPPTVRRSAARLWGLACSALARVQPWLHVYPMPPELSLPSKVGVRVGRRGPFSVEYPIWWGSAWFALSRRGTRRLLELVDSSAEVVDHFQHAVIPSESLTHTLLVNAPDVRVERASLHHIRWSDAGSGRPDVFAEEDLPGILASGKFFARKFERDSPVLDRLDDVVLGRVPVPHPS
ncbi:beta-1,6-N-acetylglucosaminyltransferase [Modestobacter lacusdianchii]